MFDSSDEEDVVPSNGAAVVPQAESLRVDWLYIKSMSWNQKVAISALPGCRFRNIYRDLNQDLDKLQTIGFKDIVVLVTKGELRKYRVPNLFAAYEERGFCIHHFPFPDGTAPSVNMVVEIFDLVRQMTEADRRILIHCMGGLGRACVIAACILLYFDNSLTPDMAISILRSIRGLRAVQTVKQYNFIQDFRGLYEAWMDEDLDRSVSR
ncbi:Cyclin-dependent kinase inhibitor 3 [Halocaridina rubra]|uniref:protein-tyrosine-phosphatase n=1 Tax=Halocaridina rubra TaxID=373956 RepID=A0AAN8WVH5_HALRR